MAAVAKKVGKILLVLAAAALAFVLLWNFLQFVFAHRLHPFLPDYDQVDLAPILDQEVLTDEDYQLLYAQTGLGKVATGEKIYTST